MKKRLVKPTSQHQTEKVSLYIFELTDDCLELGCDGGGGSVDVPCGGNRSACELNTNSCPS